MFMLKSPHERIVKEHTQDFEDYKQLTRSFCNEKENQLQDKIRKLTKELAELKQKYGVSE